MRGQYGLSFRLLTNPYSKKRYVKVHKKQTNSCVRTCKVGCRGEAPARKSIVILRRVRRPLGAEGSRAAPIYKGGAVPVRSGLMCIIVQL